MCRRTRHVLGLLHRKNLIEYATRIGLDKELFVKCLDNGTQSQEVAKDIADAKHAGISSTPSILINGYYISGVPDLDYLEEVINNLEQETVPRIQEHQTKG